MSRISTTTNAGLHDFVVSEVLKPFVQPGKRAVDLGAGPGAMTQALETLGYDVIAADKFKEGYQARPRHIEIDFDQPDFASQIGAGQFDVVTAIEVIEHVESPIGFLRNIGRLLNPKGIAVISTPNVDCAPARVKFFLTGRVRAMDEFSEPTHISPIFFDLLKRQYLKRANLTLANHFLFPPKGFQNSRKLVGQVFSIASRLFNGPAVMGDNHVWVFQRS